MTAGDNKLKPQEVAAEYRVPVGTLAAWRSRGIGPRYHKFGRHIIYIRSDVEAWFAACAVNTTGGDAA